MPIYRRLPRRGFNNAQFRTNYATVNVSDLEAKFEAGDTVNEESLRACGLVKGVCDGVKILGSGDLAKGLKLEVDKISAGAQEKVEKAGGSVSLIEKKSDAGEKKEAKAKPEKKEEAPAPAAEEKAPEPEADAAGEEE